MPRFEATLRSVAQRLDLPQPDRACILEEIAGDLEELRMELVRRGIDEEEAEARSVEMLAPTDAAIEALVSVHEPFYRSLSRRFSRTGMRRTECIGLVAVTVFPLILALDILRRGGVLRSPSPFLWPVLVAAVVVLAMVGSKALQLFLERDHDPERLRARLGAILFGCVASVAASSFGAVFELSNVVGRLEATPDGERMSVIVPWLLNTSVLLGAGLTTALVGGLCWFLLQQKVNAVEEAHGREAQLMSDAPMGAPPSFSPHL
jgi:hypothetical protein